MFSKRAELKIPKLGLAKKSRLDSFKENRLVNEAEFELEF